MKFNVNDFVILNSYHRKGKTVTLKVKLFSSDNEDINTYGLISIKLNENRIFESIFSYEYGNFTLNEAEVLQVESIIKESEVYEKAIKSYNKKSS